MPRKTLIRYFGLDFGNSNSKVCYTVRNEEGFDTPRPVTFGDKNFVPTLVHLDQYLVVKSVGSDVHSRKDRTSEDDSIQGEIKLRLIQDDVIAVNCMQAISKKFTDELKDSFNTVQLSGEAFVCMAGWPYGDEGNETIANKIKAGIGASGFIITHLQDESLAALAFSAHEGSVKLNKGKNSRVLVMDFAGINSRFSLFEQTESGLIFRKRGLIEWGGDLIDRKMIDSWFIPKYCAGINSFNSWQKQILEVRMRDFKDIFSKNINNGNQGCQFDFREIGVNQREKLFRDQFESIMVAGSAIQALENILQSIRKDQDLEEIDQVILVGGSANWYFVKDIVQRTWSESKVHTFNEPELVIAKGLALLAGEYVIEFQNIPVEPVPESVDGFIPAVEVMNNPSPSRSTSDTTQLRVRQKKSAEKLILPYVFWGTVIAAALAAVPGIAPIILIGLEIWMVIQISKVYNVKLEGTMIIVTGVLLLAMSIGLKTAVEFVLTVFYVLCFLKPLVAGIVIWGLGQAAILFFDRIVYEGGFESIW